MESLRVIAAVFALIIVVAPVLWELMECYNDRPLDWTLFFLALLSVGTMGVGAMALVLMSLWSLVVIVPTAYVVWKYLYERRV